MKFREEKKFNHHGKWDLPGVVLIAYFRGGRGVSMEDTEIDATISLHLMRADSGLGCEREGHGLALLGSRTMIRNMINRELFGNIELERRRLQRIFEAEGGIQHAKENKKKPKKKGKRNKVIA